MRGTERREGMEGGKYWRMLTLRHSLNIRHLNSQHLGLHTHHLYKIGAVSIPSNMEKRPGELVPSFLSLYKQLAVAEVSESGIFFSAVATTGQLLSLLY